MSEVKRASMLELKKEPVVSEFFGIGKFLGMVKRKFLSLRLFGFH